MLYFSNVRESISKWASNSYFRWDTYLTYQKNNWRCWNVSFILFVLACSSFELFFFFNFNKKTCCLRSQHNLYTNSNIELVFLQTLKDFENLQSWIILATIYNFSEYDIIREASDELIIARIALTLKKYLAFLRNL